MFKVIKLLVIVGYVVLSVLIFRAAKSREDTNQLQIKDQKQTGKVNSTMLKRQSAIKNAIKQGKKNYMFHINTPPPPIAGAQ